MKKLGDFVGKRELEQGRRTESLAGLVNATYNCSCNADINIVNHEDGNIHNNNRYNLENCDQKTNSNHSINILNNGDKYLRVIITKDGKLKARFDNKWQASRFTNIAEPSVTGALTRGTLINDMKFYWEIGKIDDKIFMDDDCRV